jgi:hypothetical protein
MTLPIERTRAILHTREFLRELMDSEATPGVPDAVRRAAQTLLRHYPAARDIELAHLACPHWFASPDDVR